MESDEVQPKEVPTNVDSDSDGFVHDDIPFVHDASGKCNACTHLLHYIPPTPETSWPQSFFKLDLCIADSHGLADTDGEDNAYHSFFSSKPVAEDLGHSEGMLIVKVILSVADSFTYIMLSVGLEY